MLTLRRCKGGLITAVTHAEPREPIMLRKAIMNIVLQVSGYRKCLRAGYGLELAEMFDDVL